MDVLIKNIEIPRNTPSRIYLFPNGIVNLNGEDIDAKVIELPPHGDLIDRQAVLSYFETGYLMGANMDYEDIDAIVRNPKAIPTILEAST